MNDVERCQFIRFRRLTLRCKPWSALRPPEDIEKLAACGNRFDLLKMLKHVPKGTRRVADVEEIGTFGDFFDGPTAIDSSELEGRDEAGRRLLNRIKFGSESLLLTPFVYFQY